MKKRWQDVYVGVPPVHYQFWIETDNGDVYCNDKVVTNTSNPNWEDEVEKFKLKF